MRRGQRRGGRLVLVTSLKLKVRLVEAGATTGARPHRDAPVQFRSIASVSGMAFRGDSTTTPPGRNTRPTESAAPVSDVDPRGRSFPCRTESCAAGKVRS